MTETDTIAFLIFVGGIVILYLLATSYLNVREIRRLRIIKNKAITQLEFGEARHKLFVLIGEGDLRDDSITFLLFYAMNTIIMRNPDKYSLIAKNLRESFLLRQGDSSATAEALKAESAEWSDEVKAMVVQNISAMNTLMVLHSPVLRLIVDLARNILPVLKRIIKRELGVFTLTTRFIAKNSAEMETFVETKENLQHLAHC